MPEPPAGPVLNRSLRDDNRAESGTFSSSELPTQ